MEVEYTLTEDNRIIIEYSATTDQDTPLNITNHSYFNLSGHESGSVRRQILWIDADEFTKTNEELIPTGEILAVEGTPMDFRTSKEIGLEIDSDYEALKIGRGYDHNWVLNNHGEFKKIASLYSEDTGIEMDVYTDLPGVQIYTANFVENERGKNGVVYQMNQGVCFETQYFPDSVNHSNFTSSLNTWISSANFNIYSFGYIATGSSLILPFSIDTSNLSPSCKFKFFTISFGNVICDFFLNSIIIISSCWKFLLSYYIISYLNKIINFF